MIWADRFVNNLFHMFLNCNSILDAKITQNYAMNTSQSKLTRFISMFLCGRRRKKTNSWMWKHSLSTNICFVAAYRWIPHQFSYRYSIWVWAPIYLSMSNTDIGMLRYFSMDPYRTCTQFFCQYLCFFLPYIIFDGIHLCPFLVPKAELE